eukprot:TRINITY_DN9198_c0_g1_i1.p1 TRINITY_DN9198_c0_g1~~TRINITY_DN9198_c0_g1_i1.p1  ORF type:complete len:180 (+),score=42.28 TRINITY_DN9198_c0_g1_i1:57-596(+)
MDQQQHNDSAERVLYRTSSIGPYYLQNTQGELSRVQNVFLGYALLIFLLGGLAVMYTPQAGFQFNPKAQSGLISAAACGGSAILWGVLFGRGQVWALKGALYSTLLFVVAFGWRATVAWREVFGEHPEKWWAASLISAMGIASAALLVAALRWQAARADTAAMINKASFGDKKKARKAD